MTSFTKSDIKRPNETQEETATFSPTRLVSLSKCRCDNTIVNTAWDRLLVSFMLVAATVLHGPPNKHPL